MVLIIKTHILYIHGAHVAHKYFLRHVRQHILDHINLKNSVLLVNKYGYYIVHGIRKIDIMSM